MKPKINTTLNRRLTVEFEIPGIIKVTPRNKKVIILTNGQSINPQIYTKIEEYNN